MSQSHFILFYDYAPDYMERRDQFRGDHLGLARAAVERGELELAGAFNDPADGAAFIFKGEDASAAEAFAKVDPYVLNGLVTGWRVRKWNTVVGANAANPVT